MQLTRYKCDICGKIEEGDDYQSPEGWASLHCEAAKEGGFWCLNKHICLDCGDESGLSTAREMLEAIHGRPKHD